ncbi:peptidoglycan-binding protein [Streptomyces olivochromogenes]|uniref:peptidoglycan-binding protein n=1 Tax=Streptomyces olivochromogenes TaxID=1963 RepID=UPI001F18F8A8|nr:peptidoglycan-binding protein [Streptomyces olivochromogenes]
MTRRPKGDAATGMDDNPTVTLKPVTAPRRRHVRIVAAVLAVGLAGAGAAVTVPWGKGGTHAASEPEAEAGTAKVERKNLSDSRSLDGTLGYARPQTVKGYGDGIVTWLAPTGSTVTRGKELYRVDDRKVPLLYGAVPLYRRLEGQNLVGRDVRVIADNLRALGYDVGVQPSPGQVVTVITEADDTASGGDGKDPGSAGGAEKGAASTGSSAAQPSPAAGTGKGAAGSASPAPHASSSAGSGTAGSGTAGSGTASSGRVVTRMTVGSGDGVLTPALVNAIKRWQTHNGVPSTGVLGPGDVVVLSGPVRVDSAGAQMGDAVAAPLLKVTSTDKSVTVSVDASDVGSIRRGDAVTVQLPNGTAVAAKVAGVGSDAEASEGGNGQPKVTVTVTFIDPDKVKKLDSAPVQVAFVSETRRGVLVVPVTALLALREGGYGLRTAAGRIVAVKTGLIAKGLVEVSGAGIAEGTRVVTSS